MRSAVLLLCLSGLSSIAFANGPGIFFFSKKPCSHGSQAFTYTGAAQSFTLPAGACTAGTIKLWGGGGGGGSGTYTSYPGGAGAFVSGNYTLSSAQTLTIVVAGGGASGTNTALGGYLGGGTGKGFTPLATWRSGGGGGLSGVFTSATPSQANALLIAAGGGGGGHSSTPSNCAGGFGGGATGGDGKAANTTIPGKGATQSAGGAGGTGGTYGNGTSGTALQGGSGNTRYGGGGGGGYYGGGGGSDSSADSPGGGGGSSWWTGTGVTNGSSIVSTGNAAPNTADADYSAGVAVGGGTATAGGPGKVVIIW